MYYLFSIVFGYAEYISDIIFMVGGHYVGIRAFIGGKMVKFGLKKAKLCHAPFCAEDEKLLPFVCNQY